MKISRRAIGDRTLTPTQVTYPAPGGLAQDRHIEGLPLGTRGGLLVTHTFPLDAEYEFSVTGGIGFGGGGAGAAIDVTLDGEKLDDRRRPEFPRQRDGGPAYDWRRARGQGAVGGRGRSVLGLPQ